MPPDDAPTSTRRFARVGRYQILATIAKGGMSVVYRAQDASRQGEIALKVMLPELTMKPNSLERFQREGRLAAKLQHENIVRVYESGERFGIHFMALELVQGIDLDYYLQQKGRLPPVESLQLIGQAAKALGHMHEKKIVHRDIKPANFILAQQNGQSMMKLIDLGLAREHNDDERRIAKRGTALGTVDYMAPEQAQDSGSADVRSDIYSLGCTWYELLAGRPPFPEGDLAERIQQHAEIEPPDVRQFNPPTTVAMVKTLQRMMAKDPTSRHQTPAELLQDLAACGAS
jgi:eukaryotic-like serine/threonine-protein kinase